MGAQCKLGFLLRHTGSCCLVGAGAGARGVEAREARDGIWHKLGLLPGHTGICSLDGEAANEGNRLKTAESGPGASLGVCEGWYLCWSGSWSCSPMSAGGCARVVLSASLEHQELFNQLPLCCYWKQKSLCACPLRLESQFPIAFQFSQR